MKHEIKVGILGCGNIARTKHIPALSKLEGVEIIGFYDHNPASAQNCAALYGGGKVFESDEALLHCPNIDVVHICTPNNTHAELAIKALEAGKHVMVEKPMAITFSDAKRMLEVSRKSGKKLSVSHQQRFREDAWQLKKIIENDELGEIYFAKAHAIRRRGVPSWGTFLNPDIQGGGPLIDVGCHAIDMTLWLMDNYRPHMVVCNTYQKLGRQAGLSNSWEAWSPEKFDVEDSAFGFITMKNGATLTVETSWALNSLDTSNITSILCGTKGGADMHDGLRINTDRNSMLQTILPLAGKDYEFNRTKIYTPADMEARLWIDCLRNDTEPVVKPEQVMIVAQIIEAMYRSASTGKPVFLSDV